MANSMNLGHAGSGMNNNSKQVPIIMSTAKEVAMGADKPYSFDLSIHFRGGVTYAITLAPTGMTLDTDTGILSGTPDSQIGGRPIVTATNANGTSEDMVFDYTVVTP